MSPPDIVAFEPPATTRLSEVRAKPDQLGRWQITLETENPRVAVALTRREANQLAEWLLHFESLPVFDQQEN